MEKKVKIRNFRNYGKEEVEFGAGINIVIGGNGRGKTNLLEAIFLLSKGKSFRAIDVKEMIKSGEEEEIGRAHV